MPSAPPAPERKPQRAADWLRRGTRRWGGVFRRAPIGVLTIAALLFFTGAGLTLTGIFYLLAGEEESLLLWLVLLPVGPLMIYVALLLASLHPRAWSIMVSLLVLMIISSAARVVLADAMPWAPLSELLFEGVALAYLRRQRVRRAFGGLAVP